MANADNKSQNPAEKYRVAGLAFEMGFIIALPLIGFLLLGKYLDQRFHTDPFLKIVAIFLALALTSIWLTRRFSELLESMRQNSDKDKKAK